MKLRAVSFLELVRILRTFGFKGPFSGGKHLYMVKENLRITLPNPHRKEISPDLLMRILRQADISREDWIKMIHS
ncbi:MAG: type II toxin-antitoxin system HicA family toxin [Candidatus Atribacteria bacterium]|nr:type II toxin-antitoxin system HicA family toxin [Candidatus Atribacteria bacterium]